MDHELPELMVPQLAELRPDPLLPIFVKAQDGDDFETDLRRANVACMEATGYVEDIKFSATRRGDYSQSYAAIVMCRIPREQD